MQTINTFDKYEKYLIILREVISGLMQMFCMAHDSLTRQEALTPNP